MFGSLQTTGWSGAGPFRSMAIIATIAGSILVADSAHCGTPQIVDETAHARPAAHGPCLADPRYFAPADVAIRPSWRVLPCMREEAGAVCAACATCAPDAWCAPVKTRGIGPRSPGGGPDD
jgi:hypothetical protein